MITRAVGGTRVPPEGILERFCKKFGITLKFLKNRDDKNAMPYRINAICLLMIRLGWRNEHLIEPILNCTPGDIRRAREQWGKEEFQREMKRLYDELTEGPSLPQVVMYESPTTTEKPPRAPLPSEPRAAEIQNRPPDTLQPPRDDTPHKSSRGGSV